VIGIPKTIDNDLSNTDHCPGYGSVIKHVGTTVRELACDNASMGQGDLVQILEVMGRSAGWIAAGASLAKRRDHPHDPPHIILLPELPFDPEKFGTEVKRVLSRERSCLVVVGEGLVDGDGNYVTAEATTDAFGHARLGGVGEYLREVLETQVPGVKTRVASLGIAQRAAAHCSSKTDNDEAFLAGQAAVRAAINGESGKMVTLVRGDTDQYTCETGLAALSDIANGIKKLPREWINEDGVSMNFQFLRYAQPLIQGEVTVPFDTGLPVFAQLDKSTIDKVLPAYET
jgi:6-phosphofructokinase 1